ncbi:MAG: dihydroorotase [Planctomycetota bacterium]|jgi:dihydroorotase
MSEGGDLLVRGGSVVSLDGVQVQDVLILGGKVQRLAMRIEAPERVEIIEAAGKLVFPGLIDPQVHFREPGGEEREDLATGSLAAVGGGVTSFMEMPNTSPATTDPERLADKLRRAAGRAHADHAFFLGASPENADQLGEWEQMPGCAGVKVFMGSSTGDLLVPDDASLERVLRSGRRRVAVHAEDEPRLQARYAKLEPGTGVSAHPQVRDVECALLATTRLINLAERCGRPVHVLHLSTAEEVALIRERDLGELVTAEVTPNHLFLEAPDCYERYGSIAQMNPPIRDRRHQDALRQGLLDGVITCIGSDHAPHTRAAKDRAYPDSPSGIPGVQTILPLLLMGVRDGWLQLPDILRICVSGPARVYGLAGKGPLAPGMDGDLVIVDPGEKSELPLSWLHSRAGFSPYAGWTLAGWPEMTILRGFPVYAGHAPLGPVRGRMLRFD